MKPGLTPGLHSKRSRHARRTFGCSVPMPLSCSNNPEAVFLVICAREATFNLCEGNLALKLVAS
jgi:hypothetical protein